MKCKYRVRKFSSKGAFLVLSWTMLISMVCTSVVNSLISIRQIPQFYFTQTFLYVFGAALVFIPLCGWLADAKFGNYKTFQAGTILLFIATVMYCLFFVLAALVWESNHTINLIFFVLTSTVFLIGGCLCFATALPLGLDQLPGASSSSITSYIVWFVCTIFVGLFLSENSSRFVRMCMEENTSKIRYHLIWALLLSICMSIVLATDFLLKKKWLIIEPKSPQSFKTFYQVLKFAVKHKAPLNRSAFTYWEKDIPSRLDLGKSKYGGPFTIEQVEDVKTILHLLVISLPLFVITFNLLFNTKLDKLHETFTDSCKNTFVYDLLASYSIYATLGTFAHEFFVYPFFGNKLPSILKRIGAVTLIMTLVCFVCFLFKLAHFLSHSSEATIGWIVFYLYNSTVGMLYQVLLTSLLEFMCAQSPYNMRGLLLSLAVPIILVSYILGVSIGLLFWNKLCTQQWCILVLIAIRTIFCLIGFLLFCVVARWYKMRVRNDDYSTQQVVEEVYDRYLTAAAAHSATHGTTD